MSEIVPNMYSKDYERLSDDNEVREFLESNIYKDFLNYCIIRRTLIQPELESTQLNIVNTNFCRGQIKALRLLGEGDFMRWLVALNKSKTDRK